MYKFLLKNAKLLFSVLAITMLILISTFITMWDAEIGFGIIKTSKFWVDTLLKIILFVSAIVGTLSAFLTSFRNKRGIYDIQKNIIGSAKEITNDGSLTLFEEDLDEVNDKRIKVSRQDSLLLMFNHKKTYELARTIYKEIEDGNLENFEKIEYSIELYSSRNIMSVGTSFQKNDNVSVKFSLYVIYQIFIQIFNKLPFLTITSLMVINSSKWTWENSPIWFIYLFTIFSGIYASSVIAESVITDKEEPAYNTKLLLMENFLNKPKEKPKS